MNWLLKLLPADTRALIVLGQRIMSSLDSAEEQKAAIDYGVEMLRDGKVTVSEWAKFGSKTGILRGPH